MLNVRILIKEDVKLMGEIKYKRKLGLGLLDFFKDFLKFLLKQVRWKSFKLTN